MTVRELGNHAVLRVVGLYSTSSLRSLRDVRMDWYWIGTGLAKDCKGLANLMGKR